MAGQRQKAPGDLQGHRKPRALRVVPPADALEGDVLGPTDASAPASALRVPDAPRAYDRGEMRPEVLEQWAQFWQAPVAWSVDLRADGAAIAIMFQNLNELAVVSEVIASQRLVRGSMGQARENPLIPYRNDLDRQVKQAMDRFGMNPLARFRLGVEAGEAADTLSEMQRALDAASARVQEMPGGLG